MIKPLTKDEFIHIATNGICINLYDNECNDYIQSLIQFIDSAPHEYYIFDFEKDWCEIAKDGISAIKVAFKTDRIVFHLTDTNMSIPSDRNSAAMAIKIVYMHTVVWEAINNDGKISQPITPWPV